MVDLINAQIVKKEPLVSVIVRTFNREKNFESAIASLSQQKYPELEVIIVNDGGSDVGFIVEKFKNDFSNMIYMSLEKNQGRSVAANCGLDNVTGQYVMFLDDDDSILPEHISILVENILENEKYQVVYTGTKVESPSGEFIISEAYNVSVLRFQNFLPIHSVLFCRSLLEFASFDESLSVYEDWDFWLQLSLRSDFLHVKDKVTAIYRATGNSGVGVIASKSKRREAKFKIIDKWYPLWKKEDIFNIFFAMENKKDKELKEHQAVINENSSRMDFQIKEIESLKRSNCQLNKISDNLTEANDSLNRANHILDKDNKKLCDISDNWTEANDSLNRANHILEKDNKKLGEISDNLTAANNELVRQNVNLVEENNNFVQENVNLVEKNSSLSQMKDQLTKANDELITIVAEKDILNQRLTEDLNLVYNSTSWKVTNFLRRIKQFF